jgi:hypothetical protein
MMDNVAALSFRSYEDFEACNEYIDVQPGETATSSDGMFTVIIKTERRMPPGTLVVTTGEGRRIFVRVISGAEQVVDVAPRTHGCIG